MTTDNRTNEPTAEQILVDEWIRQADRAKSMTGMDAIWFPDAEETLAALRAHGLLSEGAPSGDDRSLSAWPTVDEVRETFKKSADRLAFDRWLTAVERAAAGKALTEAANELALLDDGGKRGLAGHSKSSASAITHRHAVAVIRARAEAYTEGKLT